MPLICSVRNTATRWLTTENYDLVNFDDRLVVSRGISLKTARRDIDAGRVAGPQLAADRERLARAARVPIDELLAPDAGNRVVWPQEVERVAVSRRMKFAKSKIQLAGGGQLKYIWLDSAIRNGDYGEIRRALETLFGPKLTS